MSLYHDLIRQAQQKIAEQQRAEMQLVYDTPSETVYQRPCPQTPYEQSTGVWQKLHEETNRQYKEMRERFEKDMTNQHQAMIKGTHLVKEVSTPDKTRDIAATLDTCQKQHQREHIWNMLVLSAESS